MADAIRVLVVDEDPDVVELTGVFLERKSDCIEVTAITDPTTALDHVADGDYDCVVSDLRMPEMDGLELFEAVRETNPAMPFFLFSAVDDDRAGKEAREAGVTGFVQKGAGTEHYTELVEGIEAAVD